MKMRVGAKVREAARQKGRNGSEKRLGRLLLEPTPEEEEAALCATSDTTRRAPNVIGERGEMKRRSRQLAALLAILFGLFLLLGLTTRGLAVEPAASLQPLGLFNLTRPTATATAALAQPNKQTQTATTTTTTRSASSTTTTTTTTTPSVAKNESETNPLVNAEEGELEESAGELDKSEPEAEKKPVEEPETNTKLAAFLVGAADEAADQLVASLKPGGERAPVEVETSDDVDVEDSEHVGRRELANATSSDDQLRKHQREADDEELRAAFETYAKWRSAADQLIELVSRKLMPVVIEHGYEIDGLTVTGLLQVFNGIRALKPWAMKLLDASAKLTPGLLVGTQSDFGDYDECLNVRVDDPSGLGLSAELDPESGLPSSTLIGRYCLADVEFPKPPRGRLAQRNEELNTSLAPIELRRPLLNFSETAAYKDTIFVETGNFFHMLYVDPVRVGVCLTNKIEPDSFARLLNKVLEEFKVSVAFRGRCVTKYERVKWTSYQLCAAWILSAACSLVVLCTLLELLHTKMLKFPAPRSLSKWKLEAQRSLCAHKPLFTSFSLIRNTRRLFKPQQQSTQLSRNSPAPHLSHLNSSSANSSSSECSPSIERRGSVASSALGLISQNQGPILTQCAQTNERPKRENNLRCLHGVRVLTMTWMLVNHTYLFGGFFVLWAHRRLIDIAEWPKSLSFQLVLNGWLTVETYFFLSAAIIVLNVMPLMKARNFSYLAYIFHRLVRLLPAYLGLVCLNFLWPLISSGPVWLVKGKSFIQDPCENYLWTNFLFINNWIWPEKQCMVHTWFLSADFQLYLVAPIVVYLLCRRPVFGHALNIIVALLASILSGFVIYANKLMPSTLINKLEFDSIKQQLSYSYFATYQHLGPYCLGIFIGYLLHNRPQVRLPKHLTWSLWLLLPPLSFTTLLLTYLWNGAYSEPELINPSPLVSAFYVAIHRTIWTSLLAWIVFACATGRAKLLSSFLSHSAFIPLSRLSFSIYLVHLPVIMFRALNLRHTIEWTDANILWEACGNFVASTLVGYFVNVVFESPFINLEAVVFKRGDAHLSANLRQAANEQAPLKGAKAKCVLQPQSLGFKSNHEDDSSSVSKSSASSNQPASSPEQERKVSDSSLLGVDSLATTSTTAAQQSSVELQQNSQESFAPPPIGEQRWPPSGALYNGSLKVKALRPKHIVSVEKIFANERHQVEPGVNYDAAPPCGDNLRLEDSISDHQRERQLRSSTLDNRHRARDRAYSSTFDSLKPSSSIGKPISNNISDSLYPLTSEYQHYARAGFQQRLTNRLVSRPSQYATLARGSRFHYDPNNSSLLLNRYEAAQEPSHQHSLYLDAMTKPRSQPAEEHLETASRLKRQRAQLFNQQQHRARQGRYNTLTGTGAIKEWRQQQLELRYENDRLGQNQEINHDWPPLNSDESNWHTASWLQPGALIPRIDSSTLRRQPKRLGETGAQSIEEEPAFEDAAL